MIELRTGIPGSGKTLSMVEQLARLVARWERKPDELRPVYVLGIDQLAIPGLSWFQLPGQGERDESGKWLTFLPDWSAVPDGALIVIDEAQCVFPPRSTQSKAPPHVAWLNTHRHHGIDLWITTQGPKLIDYGLRELVGKHQHFRRLFGGKRASVYEWDCCENNVKAAARDAVLSHYEYPKGSFKFYKSAEVHTKQTFKLPRWIIIPIFGIALSIYAVPRAFGVLTGAMTGKGINESAQLAPAASAPAKAAAAPAPPPPPAASAATAIAAAPVQPPPAKAPEAPPLPRVLGCMTMGERCLCVGVDGRPAEVQPAQCIDGATTITGIVPLELHPVGGAPAPRSEAPKPTATGASGGGVLGFNAGDIRTRSAWSSPTELMR